VIEPDGLAVVGGTAVVGATVVGAMVVGLLVEGALVVAGIEPLELAALATDFFAVLVGAVAPNAGAPEPAANAMANTAMPTKDEVVLPNVIEWPSIETILGTPNYQTNPCPVNASNTRCLATRASLSASSGILLAETSANLTELGTT
jgi:hypothetical protein